MDGKLETLRQSLAAKAPYRAGVVDVDPKNLILFYGKDRKAGRIDFNDVTSEELEHLASTCDPATFGVKNEDVFDESYRKAGKLDSDFFASRLDLDATKLLDMALDDLMEGDGDPRARVEAEIYKLNVYGEGSFFKPHVDTPRGENMFGSLVIVFKTPHEGGSLIVRDHGQEWTFDSAGAVATHEEPCVGYIAFYSDVEHEVTPVTKGYRVTLTYNLYSTEKPLSIDHPHLTSDAEKIKVNLQALLDDPSFLPEGGYLGFGLNRYYPVPRFDVNRDFNTIIHNLKGNDAALVAACKDLPIKAHFRAALRTDVQLGVYVVSPMFDLIDIPYHYYVEGPLTYYLREYFGGLVVNPRRRLKNSNKDRSNGQDLPDESSYPDDYDDEDPRPDIEVFWVNRLQEHSNQLQSPVLCYGNEPSWEYLYAYICLIASIGPYGARDAKWDGGKVQSQ
ncbi:hypothetical protein NLI96_g259 [Meripilus lineatus]|uniref:Fe2OG dioxygenase domain-containing protein n=1 Tax=Meripilus lineatus TaxID=2056292 RepID=A0AAD5YP15_9APHY|nr:hypothetical protein NLI96_g259 [Physisporinus lineatus]